MIADDNDAGIRATNDLAIAGNSKVYANCSFIGIYADNSITITGTPIMEAITQSDIEDYTYGLSARNGKISIDISDGYILLGGKVGTYYGRTLGSAMTLGDKNYFNPPTGTITLGNKTKIADGLEILDFFSDNTKNEYYAIGKNGELAAKAIIGVEVAITPTISGKGTVTPNVANLISGQEVSFTITPEQGWKIADVLVNGESKGAVTSVAFTAMGNDTIAVTFVLIDTPTNPQTGDDANTGLWLWLMLSAMLIVAAMLHRRFVNAK
ncbi:LPXTG cell wall anchor domain-containing protein [Eubacteriales bacterium OttesenSCG-928-M02]|nr:LPXTG cell wall anchor domain-containing protein [Eubacteriales bacterium OttesenSCG-928-M02]